MATMASDFSIAHFFIKGADLYCGIDKNVLATIDDSPTGHWRGHKGIIHVSAMDNRYLYNCIRYLARKGRRSTMLEAEVMKRYKQYMTANTGKLAVLIDPPSPDPVSTVRNIIRE